MCKENSGGWHCVLRALKVALRRGPPGFLKFPFEPTVAFKSKGHTPTVKGWAKSTLVLLAILLVSTLFFALIYRPPDPEGVPDAPLVAIDVRLYVAAILPASIEVEQGTLVVLNVTSMDEDHHFGLTAFGISRWISANETA